MKRLVGTVFLFILIGLASSGCVNSMFYYPTDEVYQTPARYDLDYHDVVFRSIDGTLLTGWFLPAKGKAEGTVIHCHGNAQNMTAHLEFVRWLPKQGFNLFVFDYRGYGRSKGKPSRSGLYKDCLSAIAYVQTMRGVDPERIVVFGQSLGAAVLLDVVGRNDIKGIRAVAVDSTFASYRLMVREKLKAIPLLSLIRWPLSFLIVSDSHSPIRTIDKISPVPLVIIHGTSDRIVPYEQGLYLYRKARDPKQLWTVKDGRHTEALTRYSDSYRRELVNFFRQALRTGPQQGVKGAVAPGGPL